MQILLRLVQATVSTDGSFALTSGEVGNVTTTLTNTAGSLLSMFMQFIVPITILAVATGVIAIVLNKLGHK